MENKTHNNTEKITEEAPSVKEHEELETLIIASIETLKRQNMKCGINEVLKLVQDSLEENVSRESFEKTFQILIDSDFVKFDSISNRKCLSIPKNNTHRDAFDLKEELQFFKYELVKEFKRLTQGVFAEINSLENDVLTPDAPITNTPLTQSDVYMNHLLDQVSFLREQKSKRPTDKLFIRTCSQASSNISFKRFSVTRKYKAIKYRTDIRPGTNFIDNTNANTKKEP